MELILLIIASYLLGSVPFGLLIAKSKGVDLRKVGSGNIGATNVGRALGIGWARLCFILDVLKGMAPVVAGILLTGQDPSTAQLFIWLLAGTASILGHIFPVYLKFKGGKGVATSLGVVLGVWPYFTVCGLVCFLIWFVCLKIWRYVSLGSIIAAAVFPIILSVEIAVIDSWQFATLWPLMVASLLLSAIVIIRHKDNIDRLLNGTENKIEKCKRDK
ncbi:MAG: glycerol-3-phosphate 1-O-acyltransferase PlsY [Phycisphaerae bacterium]|jgi:glycerol-3-phosphate acyltransferase PlsY